MKEQTPAESVAVYVRRALEELGVSQAELARRVGVAVGRPYSSTAAKAWLKKGNAPGDVLFALHRMTGLGLDLYAGMKEREPNIEERFLAIERKYEYVLSELEQLRREAGQSGRKELDGPGNLGATSHPGLS
jgi:transcriptional regulator with XRE-family HTH domain